MKIRYIIQIITAIIVLVCLISAITFSNFVKKKTLVYEATTSTLFEELNSTDTHGSLPAAQAMKSARNFLELGDYNQSREKLLFITNFYSEAPFSTSARQILGEMNMDQLLSPSNLKYKKSYTVKNGDSLSKIARNHETTIENIMELNGLLYNNRIHPGQSLVLLPLKFSSVINVKKKTLTLYYDGQYIKEYPILESQITSKSKKITTTVDRAMAYDGDTTVSKISNKYLRNKKLLTLKSGNLQIRATRQLNEESLGSGFFLKDSDMEEFALLIKSGDPVEIQL